MDKDIERTFLETISKALVSLPFDLKVLLEAVADPDLEHDVRELAAATVVHVITPKDGNVEAPARFCRGRRPAAAGAGARSSPKAAKARPLPASASTRTTAVSTSELGVFRAGAGRRHQSTGSTAAGARC